MHHQIERVIQRMEFMPGTVLVELSAGEQTPLGNILSLVYYQTSICDLIDPSSRFGFPHNGGQHTFTFKGPWKDAVAVLELIKEVVASKFTLSAECSKVLNEFSYISQEIISSRKKM